MRMLDEADRVTPAEHNPVLWRYLTNAKFAELVRTRALRFTRQDKLRELDNGEGMLAQSRAFTKASRGREQFLAAKTRRGDWEENLWHSIHSDALSVARRVFLSCWHMNPVENEAMWKAYAPQAGSVAVRSTPAALIAALDLGAGSLRCAPVAYVDSATIAGTNATFAKGLEFSFEREWRLCIEGHRDEQWISIACNIEAMIDKIVLSPNSGTYELSQIRALLEKHQSAIPLEGSAFFPRDL